MAFDTTRWSIIARAKRGDESVARAALEDLCTIYWQPLYAYLRHKGYSSQNAEDVIQSLFAHLLEHNFLDRVDRERGKFRSFLLTCLTNYLINQHKMKQALKRNEGKRPLSIDATEAEQRYALQPRDELSPEKVYERQWALTLMQNSLEEVRKSYKEEGKQERFEALEPYITDNQARLPHRELAVQLKINEGAAKVAVHRLRKHYREALRGMIAKTLTEEDDVDAEIEYLLGVFSS